MSIKIRTYAVLTFDALFNVLQKKQVLMLNKGSGPCFALNGLLSLSSVFVETYGAHTLLGTVLRLFSSLCTLVHGQTCMCLTLDEAAGGLRVPFTDQ